MYISVTLTLKKRLEQVLKEAGVEKPTTIAKLTIEGTMIYDDFRYIHRNMRKTLKELDLSATSVSIIYSKALIYCVGLTTVTFPMSVTQIENNAFSGCKGLTSITIPASVKTIKNRAFADCTGLVTVTIPASVTTIALNAFINCLAHFTVDPNNPLYRSIDGKLEFSEEHLQLIAREEGEEISSEIRTQFQTSEQELIKQDRIRKLQVNSAEEWVKNLMTNSNYPYKIFRVNDIKLLLIVKISGKQQLEIPVYFKSFQKSIPQILETIQQYENVINNSQIKVLVQNSSPNDHEWLNKS